MAMFLDEPHKEMEESLEYFRQEIRRLEGEIKYNSTGSTEENREGQSDQIGENQPATINAGDSILWMGSRPDDRPVLGTRNTLKESTEEEERAGPLGILPSFGPPMVQSTERKAAAQTSAATTTLSPPWPLTREPRITGQEAFARRFGDDFRKPIITPDRFEGKTPWRDYAQHFEACRAANAWSEKQAGAFLKASLKGQALKVLGASQGRETTYQGLLDALEQRFGPGRKAENHLMTLRLRRQETKESLQELGQAVRELAYLAYPEFDEAGVERLAKGHYLEAVGRPEIREGIFRAAPTTLDEAIRAALATESFLKLEEERPPRQTMKYVRPILPEGEPRQAAFERRITGWMEHLESHLRQRNTPPVRPIPPEEDGRRWQEGRNVRCYNCGEEGHIARRCPQHTTRQSGNGGQPTPRVEGRLGQVEGPSMIPGSGRAPSATP